MGFWRAYCADTYRSSRGGKPTNLFRSLFACCFFVLLTQLLFLSLCSAAPIRIVCIQSGNLESYDSALFGMAQRLAEEGFFKSRPAPDLVAAKSRSIWHWMDLESDGRLLFHPKDFYSFDWESEKAEQIKKEILHRLETEHDVDFLLVLGTRAAKVICSLETDVPIMVLGTTDPVESKIVKSMVDSGRENLIAFINSGWYRRQVQSFHNFFSFQRLGIVYEDTQIGRNVIALQEIEEASEEGGFELVRCHTQMSGEAETVSDGVAQCHRRLLKQGVDAVYITVSVSMRPHQMRKILNPLVEAAIPTFSQEGIEAVKNGALMCFVDTGREGDVAARAIVAFTKGIALGTISQVFQMPIFLAVNLRTAAAIGWNPSLEVLLSIDQFYD